MKNKSKLLALLLAFVFVLTSCGGGGNKDASSSGAASNAKESTGSTSEAASADSKDAGAAKGDSSEPEKVSDANTLVVGVVEVQNGDYVSGFTNSSVDVSIKRLIGTYGGDTGYATSYTDEQNQFKFNKTVLAEEPKREENEKGLTYTYKIKDNLVWNDGQKITAKDYLFGAFFVNSPAWRKIGATNSSSGMETVGFQDYYDGKTKVYKGLHLIDDYTFSITINPEYLPYYFEQSFVAMAPTPLHRYTPNLDIVETKEGAQIQPKEGYKVDDATKKQLLDLQQQKVDGMKKELDASKKKAEEEGADFSKFDAIKAELDALKPEELDKADLDGKTPKGTDISKVIGYYYDNADYEAEAKKLEEFKTNADKMDPTELLLNAGALDISQKYRFKPDVTCGPYKFVSFENGMCKVTINDKFVGDKDGKKPTIKNIISQTINPKLDVDYVLNGTVDMVTNITEGEKIDKVKKAAESGKVQFAHYDRYGYGNMPFLCDLGATKYAGVRKAVAYCLDRNEFVQQVAGGYGKVINGTYGVSMPEYEANKEQLEDPEVLTQYTLNIAAGNKELDGTPYKFEKDGKTPWDAAKAQQAYDSNKENFDYWRYDDKGNKLAIYHDATENNPISDLITTMIPDNAKKMGLQYTINKVDFATLLKDLNYPDKTNPQAATAFNMGTSFGVPFDPWYQYHSSQVGSGDNKTHTADKDLDAMLVKNRKIKSGDTEAWNKGFMEFQKWYNQNLPEIPLYSNDIHDVFTNRVKGYQPTSNTSWDVNVCNLSLGQ